MATSVPVWDCFTPLAKIPAIRPVPRMPQESVLLMIAFSSREIEITLLCNPHLGSYDLSLPVLDELTVEHNDLFGPDVDRGSPDAEGEGPRLSHETHRWIV